MYNEVKAIFLNYYLNKLPLYNLNLFLRQFEQRINHLVYFLIGCHYLGF